MNHFAILCGSAPEGFRQKKLDDICDFLKDRKEENVICFPNGVSEILLEKLLGEAFDKACINDECQVLLYLCAQTEADLNANLSGSGLSNVKVVRLGKDEIRKEVIAYYAGLAEKLDVAFKVDFSVDGDFVSEKSLGYEVLEMNQLAE